MATPKSGQKTVAAPGTELPMVVAADTFPIGGPVAIKALTTNTDLVYIGNDGAGAVSSSTGYPLAAGEQIILNFVGTLTEVMIDAAVAGEGAAWLVL